MFFLTGQALRTFLTTKNENERADLKIAEAVAKILSNRPKHPAGIILSGLPGTGKSATVLQALSRFSDACLEKTAFFYASREATARELFEALPHLARQGITQFAILNVDNYPDFMEYADCFRWEDLDYPQVGVFFVLTCNNPLATGILDRLSHFLVLSTDLLFYHIESIDAYMNEKNGVGSHFPLHIWQSYIGDLVIQALLGPHTADFEHVKKYSNANIRHDAQLILARSALVTIWRAVLRAHCGAFGHDILEKALTSCYKSFGEQRTDSLAYTSLINLFVFGGLLEKTLYTESIVKRPWSCANQKTIADTTRYPYAMATVLENEAACVHPALRLTIIREVLGDLYTPEVEHMMRREVLAESIRLLLFSATLPDSRRAFLPFVCEKGDEQGVEYMPDIILFENTSGAVRYIVVSLESSPSTIDLEHARYYLTPAHCPEKLPCPGEVVILYDGPTQEAKDGLHPYSCLEFLNEFMDTQDLAHFYAATGGARKMGFQKMYGEE